MCGSVWKAAAPSSQGAQEARDNTEASCGVQLQTVPSTAASSERARHLIGPTTYPLRLDIYNSGKQQLHDTNSWVSSGDMLHWLHECDSVKSRLADIYFRNQRENNYVWWRQLSWISGNHKLLKWLRSWRWFWPQEHLVVMYERERASESLQGLKGVSRCSVTHTFQFVCVERSSWSLVWFLKGWLLSSHKRQPSPWVIRHIVQGQRNVTSIHKLNLEICVQQGF